MSAILGPPGHDVQISRNPLSLSQSNIVTAVEMQSG